MLLSIRARRHRLVSRERELRYAGIRDPSRNGRNARVRYHRLSRLALCVLLLAALQDICLIPCIEYDDLQTAIAAYKNFATR
jgi:hypothetical protein